MFIVKNQWPFLQSVENDIKPLIDAQGLTTQSEADVRNLSKKIQTKPLLDLFQYFQCVSKIIELADPAKHHILPKRLLAEGVMIKEKIALVLTLIRTIRAAYKNPDAFEKLGSDLGRLQTVIDTYLNQILARWLGQDTSAPLAGSYDLPIVPDYFDYSQIWFEMETVKKTWFSYNNIVAFPWLKNFDESQKLDDAVKNIRYVNKTPQFLIGELFKAKEILGCGAFSEEPMRKEFIVFLHNIGVLSSGKAGAQAEKESSNQAKTQLDSYMGLLLHKIAVALAPTYKIIYEDAPASSAEIGTVLPRAVLNRVIELQDQLTHHNEGDLSAANTALQQRGGEIFQFTDRLEQWIADIVPMLSPFGQVGRKFQTIFSKLKTEVGRQLEDFQQYADSVREENERTDLNQVLEEKIQKIEEILEKYQAETGEFIKSKLPELSKLSEIVAQYEQQLGQIKQDMAQIFKQFNKKELNLHPSITLWEDKYSEIIARTRFSIKRALATIISVFSEPLAKEQEFFERLNDISASQDGIAETLSADYLMPEKLTEPMIRERISALNTKIDEIDRLKNAHTAERGRYQQLLEKFLKDNHNIESKKCIICHKQVRVGEDHFIQCEFCKSLSHYTCAAWWINKYNSCPVCHNQYTIPNSQIYDPAQIDHGD